MNGWRWPLQPRDRPKERAPAPQIQQNALLLLSCLVFAIVFWMYVAGLEPESEPTQTLARDVTVKVQYIPGQIPLQESSPKTTSVTLQGPASLLQHPADLLAHASCDLTGVTTPGEQSVPIRVQAIDPDIVVKAVMPERAHVFLDSNHSRDVHVAWHSMNQPAPGLVAGSPIIDPDIVTVTGPSSLLPKMGAQVDFNLADVTESVYVQLDVQLTGLPQAYAHLFTVKPVKVRLFLPIQRKLQYATIGISPEFTGVPAPGLTFRRAEVIPQTVTVSGPPNLIQGLTTIPTAEISLGGATRSFTTRTDLDPPDGVHIETETGVLVHVELARAPERAAPPEVTSPEIYTPGTTLIQPSPHPPVRRQPGARTPGTVSHAAEAPGNSAALLPTAGALTPHDH